MREAFWFLILLNVTLTLWMGRRSGTYDADPPVEGGWFERSAAGGAGSLHEIHTKFPDPLPYGTFDMSPTACQAALPILGSSGEIIMVDETSRLVDRVLDEREALQSKQEKLTLFLGQGAPGVSDTQRYLLPLQLCAMTMYGDILDRRLEDLGFPTGDLEPFYGPELDNVGMENDDAD